MAVAKKQQADMGTLVAARHSRRLPLAHLVLYVVLILLGLTFLAPLILMAESARAMPFETFSAQVARIAPTTTHAEPPSTASAAPLPARGEVPGTVTVYCRLEDPAGLRPGMTGHARVYTGKRPLGEIALDRVLRFVRTEFWW